MADRRSMSITITGTPNMSGARETDEQIGAAMRKLMGNMKRRAIRLVPKKSRALMRSIDYDLVSEGGEWIGTLYAGTDVEGTDAYALIIEKGNSQRAAQPYLRPALMQTRAVDMTQGGGS